MRLIVLALVLHATWATKHAGTIGGVNPHRHLRHTGESGPHRLLELVDPDTSVNRQGSEQALQICQGDCTTDESCAGDLVCFKRNDDFSPTEIPGCAGEPRGNNNYCVHAKYSQKFPELTFVGHRGPMGECAGDCDSNEDCMGDLICYQPTGSVPGCPGTSQDSDIDYCVDLKKLEMSGNYFNFVLQGDLEPGSLGRCQGDCDSDEDCKDGLYCFLRNDEDTPYCKGVSVPNVDYCVPRATPNPTKLPTKAPTPAPPTPSLVEEEPAVPVPAPSEPTESPDDPEDYPFSIFFSTAVLKESEEDVVAVSETGEETGTEGPVLEGRSSPEAKYVDLSKIVGEVLNDLFSQAGYDVSNDPLPNRRLVALARGGTSSQTVPATPSRGDLPYAWVALKTDYVVTDFTPNDGVGQDGDVRRIQEENVDTQQLTGEEIEGEVTGIVSAAIEDGTLLRMLQRRDPNVLGVADFGEEASTDVDTSSISSPTPAPVSDPEPKDSPKQPWWVWFLVVLAGFALIVLTIFTLLQHEDVPPPPPPPLDNGKDEILAVAPTFDNEESDDDEHYAPHRPEDLSNQFGVRFADEQSPPLPPTEGPKVNSNNNEDQTTVSELTYPRLSRPIDVDEQRTLAGITSRYDDPTVDPTVVDYNAGYSEEMAGQHLSHAATAAMAV